MNRFQSNYFYFMKLFIIIVNFVSIGLLVLYFNESYFALSLLATIYILSFSINIKFLNLYLDPSLVLALAIFFEIIFGVLKVINPNFFLLWLIPFLPFPFIASIFLKHPKSCLHLLNALWAWILFLGYIAISLLWSPNSMYGFSKLLILIIRGFIPGIYIIILCKYKKTYLWKWNIFLYLTAVYGALLIFLGEGAIRKTILGFNPISIAQVLFLGATVALWSQNESKLLRFSAFIFGISGALITQSRGPFISFVLANTILLIIRLFNKSINIRKVFLYFGVFLLLFTILFSPFSKKIFEFNRFITLTSYKNLVNDVNFYIRTVRWGTAIQLFVKKPIVGAGAGGYSAAYRETLRGGPRGFPHNVILEILSELGLVGLFLWMLAVFIPIITKMHFKEYTLFIILFLQSIFYAFISGDLGSNYIYVLWVMVIIGYTHFLKKMKNSDI